MPPKTNLSRSGSSSSVNSNASTDSKKRKINQVDKSEKSDKKSRVTNNQLFEMLEAMKLNTDKIPDLCNKVESIESNIESLQEENEGRISDIQAVNQRIDNITNVKLNEKLVKDVDYLKSVIDVTIPEMNKNLLRSNNRCSVIKDVIISGFPYIKLEKENLVELSMAVFEELKVKIECSEILDVFYLMKKSNNDDGEFSASQEDITETTTRIPFVVKLNNDSIVKKIISMKRKYKKLEFSNLSSEKPVMNYFKNLDNFTIFVNESMSKYHYNLLKLASKKLKDEYKFKKVWQSNGFIYTQFLVNLPIHQISSEIDIEKLISLYCNK